MSDEKKTIERLEEDLLRERRRSGRLASALHRIAAPPRPDGTYNYEREACEQIAKRAIAEYEAEILPHRRHDAERLESLSQRDFSALAGAYPPGYLDELRDEWDGTASKP